MLRRGDYSSREHTFPSQVPYSINVPSRINEHEVWHGGNMLHSDLRRRMYAGESSHMGDLQGTQRMKRQNCGNNVWGSIHGGSDDRIGTLVHFPLQETSRFHSMAYQGNNCVSMAPYWSSSSHSCNTGEHSGCPVGAISNPWYALNSRKTHMDASVAMQPSLSGGALGTAINDLSTMNLHCTQRRNSCKRKSAMEGSTGSTWQSDFRFDNSQGCLGGSFVGGFTEGSTGPNNSDTANALPFNVWNAPLYSREDELALASFRSSSPNRAFGRHNELWRETGQPHLHSLNGGNFTSIMGASLPSQPLVPRRLLISERMAAESAWSVNMGRNYFRESRYASSWSASSLHTGQWRSFEMPREVAPGMLMRNFVLEQPNVTSSWLSGATANHAISQATVGQSLSAISSRHANVRDSRPLASRMGANTLHEPLSNMPLWGHGDFSMFSSRNMIPVGPRAAYGDRYSPAVFVHRLPMPSSFTYGAGEDGLALQNFVQTALQWSQIFPAQGENRQQSPVHQFPDPSLMYRLDSSDDMRLDVDNMTYEELLALEERIGNVNTGLHDDSIRKCLKIRKRSTLKAMRITNLSQDDDAKCSICQEEYVEEDETGTLSCGHSYHSSCIKQWLALKNLCPICKAAAYS